MIDQRNAASETHWRPTCLIEAHQKPTCLVRALTLFQCIFISKKSAFRSPMGQVGLRWGMSVSDETCRGLRWVSNQECRSPMGLRY